MYCNFLFENSNNKPLTKEDLYKALGEFTNNQRNSAILDELIVTSGNDKLALETQQNSLSVILRVLNNLPSDIRQQNEIIINKYSTRDRYNVGNRIQAGIYKADTTPILKEVIKDAIKQVASKLLKEYLTEEEKHDLEYCHDVLESFELIETKYDPTKTKIEKGIAIVRAAKLLVKYYPEF